MHNRKEPVWFDNEQFNEWPKYEKIIYAKEENCKQQMFDKQLNAYNKVMCREACCADNECDTFLCVGSEKE